jgi:branched-chain amino acid transport system substrate-binding protein
LASLGAIAGCVGGDEGDESIKVGFATYQSGPYSAFGNDVIAGIELLIDEYNENGGLQGREIKFTNIDTEGDSSVAIEEGRAMLQSENVDVFGVFASTSEVQGLMNVANKNEVPCYMTVGNNVDLVLENCNRYSFRGAPNSRSKVMVTTQTAIDTLGSKVFQINPDDVFGQGVQATYEEEITAAGGEIIDSMFVPVGAEDWSAALSRIESADTEPDWIQLGHGGAGVISLFTQADQQDFEIPINVYTLHEQIVQGAPGGFFDSVDVYTSSGYVNSLDRSGVNSFKNSFQEKTGRTPSKAGANTYWHSEAVFEAIDGEDEIDTDTIVSAIKNFSGETIAGPYSYRACDNQASWPIRFTRIDSVDENGFPTWTVEAEIAKEKLPGISCEEITSQMNCSVE